ncbi:unnamed protein product [Spirodela intermedia]|uniref:Uncharacterized protein n=1 Tax=Spirodela intermedia TaxID=51605 RepID=A0A7I8JYL6_SPIIN|nr:unnamed protein product [Spirodela intermedia]
MKNHYIPDSFQRASNIRVPLAPTVKFEINLGIFQMLPNFHGLPLEEPHQHLEKFHMVYEQLMAAQHQPSPWYAHIVNFLVSGKTPEQWDKNRKNHFFSKIRNYFWHDPDLYYLGNDQILRRCDTSLDEKQLQKFFSVVFIGLQSLEIL